MGRRFMPGGLIALVVLVLIAMGIADISYNAGFSQGMTQGLLESGRLAAPEGGAVTPYLYGRAAPLYRPFGFGSGVFGVLFAVFIGLLFFGLIGRLFFRGMGGWRHFSGPGQTGQPSQASQGSQGPGHIPSMVEEWHRRMHGQESGQAPGQSGQTPNQPSV